MESLSKQELISTITKQADQIKRYEARLRDVVAAYKGLIKEKDALEASLKALSNEESSNEDSKDSVAALTQSLATLTAEKSRMEEAFQADKKVTREKYENMLTAMREENKTLIQQHQIEVGNLKAKISYEIQEREKERANHTAMLKELNMKLTSERRTKEKLEDKAVHSTEDQEAGGPERSQPELEARVRELNASLEVARRRLQRAEARAQDTPALLRSLHGKLALLERSHSVALREEQIKVKRAEEAARKTCARQEERVALLEARLAELSQTIGEYDSMRRKDQQTIQQLKETLNGSLLDKVASRRDEPPTRSETDSEKLADSEYLRTLIDRIHILKKELIAENEKMGGPVDMATVFCAESYGDPHEGCRAELQKIKAELEASRGGALKGEGARREDLEEMESLREELAMLREQEQAYRLMLDEERREWEQSIKACEEKLLKERERNEETVSELRRRLLSSEQQLRAQRERCAQLLQESDAQLTARRHREASPQPQPALPGALSDGPAHMLHYSHELARRDLDISQLRREKHALEGQYRDCQREATIEKERFKEVIRTLKEEIDRLRRSQSREGANLEYLKNVVLAYLLGGGAGGGGGGGRSHMLNAIAAVLHFSAAERAAVLAAL